MNSWDEDITQHFWRVWMSKDEERRATPQVAVSDIKEDIREIKDSVRTIYRIINENGSDGLTVKIDRNSNFRKVGSKILWLFVAGFITMAFFMLRSGLIKSVLAGGQ